MYIIVYGPFVKKSSVNYMIIDERGTDVRRSASSMPAELPTLIPPVLNDAVPGGKGLWGGQCGNCESDVFFISLFEKHVGFFALKNNEFQLTGVGFRVRASGERSEPRAREI